VFIVRTQTTGNREEEETETHLQNGCQHPDADNSHNQQWDELCALYPLPSATASNNRQCNSLSNDYNLPAQTKTGHGNLLLSCLMLITC